MKELIVGVAVVLALFLIFSVIFLVGIYWTHYPYGRKRGRRK